MITVRFYIKPEDLGSFWGFREVRCQLSKENDYILKIEAGIDEVTIKQKIEKEERPKQIAREAEHYFLVKRDRKRP